MIIMDCIRHMVGLRIFPRTGWPLHHTGWKCPHVVMSLVGMPGRHTKVRRMEINYSTSRQSLWDSRDEEQCQSSGLVAWFLQETEETVQCCQQCQQSLQALRVPMSPWPVPFGPWDRLHLDFFDPTLNQMIMINCDAYFKQIDLYPMKLINSGAVIENHNSLPFVDCHVVLVQTMDLPGLVVR